MQTLNTASALGAVAAAVAATPSIASHLPTGITPAMADALLHSAVRRDKLRAELTVVEAEYRQNLPFATVEQMDVLLVSIANETELQAGNKPNVDFVLSDAQQAHVALVRQERANWCAANKDRLLVPLLETDEQQLVSYKVRVGSKKTTTTVRFEKREGQGQKAGLIADLRAIAAAAPKNESSN